ncbi:MAG TPA: hypothetical protein VLG67_01705 [Candidatus Saccharimonadales bacterium]|nr:hypothetical protein [Candidatus Saccharimonadales bacterium]
MTSFVIASKDKNKRSAYIDEYCRELNIDKFDITLIEKNASGKNISSIGIDDIKDIHKNIFLKPIISTFKAVILDDAQLLTHQAQNALLKVLEEPPAHTIIILSVDTTESLLPTILSRCQVIELATEKISLSSSETAEFFQFIDNLKNMKIGDKLKKAEELAKDKDSTVEWFGKLILVLRDKILGQARDTLDTRGTRDTLNAMQSLHTLLKTTNINPRMAIENTLLILNS